MGSFSLWESPGSSTSLFGFQDKESMIQVLRAVDKANGYCFGDLEERNLHAMMSAAVGADFQFNSYPFLIVVVTHSDSSGLMPNIKIYRRCLKSISVYSFIERISYAKK